MFYDTFDDGVIDARWTQADEDGSTTGPTTFSETGGYLEIDAAGDALGEFNMDYAGLYQTVTGDFDVATKVIYQEATFDEATAGLMVSTDFENSGNEPGNVAVGITPVDAFRFVYDADGDGGIADGEENGGTVGLPAWVRLRRSGSDIHAYYTSSAPGAWNEFPSSPVTTAIGSSTVDVGLVNSTANGYSPEAARFEEFVSGDPLPDGVVDIVAIAQAGNLKLQTPSDSEPRLPSVGWYLLRPDGSKRWLWETPQNEYISTFSDWLNNWRQRSPTTDLTTTTAQTISDGSPSLYHDGASSGYDKTESLPGDGLDTYLAAPCGFRIYWYAEQPSDLDFTVLFIKQSNGAEIGIRHWGSNGQVYLQQWDSGGGVKNSGRIPGGGWSPPSGWNATSVYIEAESGTKLWNLPYSEAQTVIQQYDPGTDTLGTESANFTLGDTSNDTTIDSVHYGTAGGYEIRFSTNNDFDIYVGALQELVP
jgi:hypothetical protein